MNRADRKEFLRKLSGRMPRIFGGSGCACVSCKATNKLARAGFDKWPTGNPAGRKSQAAYSSHANKSKAGAATGMVIGPAGAAFYGTPAGMTRAEVEAALSAHFQQATTSPDLPRFVPAAASAPNRWTIQDRHEGGYVANVPDPGFTRAAAELHAERLNAHEELRT